MRNEDSLEYGCRSNTGPRLSSVRVGNRRWRRDYLTEGSPVMIRLCGCRPGPVMRGAVCAESLREDAAKSMEKQRWRRFGRLLQRFPHSPKHFRIGSASESGIIERKVLDIRCARYEPTLRQGNEAAAWEPPSFRLLIPQTLRQFLVTFRNSYGGQSSVHAVVLLR